MFGVDLSVEGIIKKVAVEGEDFLKTLGKDAAGHSGVQQIGTELNAIKAKVNPVLAKLTPAQVHLLLQQVNRALGDSFTPADIAAVESAGADLVALESTVQKIVTDGQAALAAKKK